jgi:hypothetical protein
MALSPWDAAVVAKQVKRRGFLLCTTSFLGCAVQIVHQTCGRCTVCCNVPLVSASISEGRVRCDTSGCRERPARKIPDPPGDEFVPAEMFSATWNFRVRVKATLFLEAACFDLVLPGFAQFLHEGCVKRGILHGLAGFSVTAWIVGFRFASPPAVCVWLHNRQPDLFGWFPSCLQIPLCSIQRIVCLDSPRWDDADLRPPCWLNPFEGPLSTLFTSDLVDRVAGTSSLTPVDEIELAFGIVMLGRLRSPALASEAEDLLTCVSFFRRGRPAIHMFTAEDFHDQICIPIEDSTDAFLRVPDDVYFLMAVQRDAGQLSVVMADIDFAEALTCFAVDLLHVPLWHSQCYLQARGWWHCPSMLPLIPTLQQMPAIQVCS